MRCIGVRWRPATPARRPRFAPGKDRPSNAGAKYLIAAASLLDNKEE